MEQIGLIDHEQSNRDSDTTRCDDFEARVDAPVRWFVMDQDWHSIIIWSARNTGVVG